VPVARFGPPHLGAHRNSANLLRSPRPSSQDIAGNKSANGAMRALGKVVAERDSVSGGIEGRAGAEVWGEGGFSADGWRGRVRDKLRSSCPYAPVARLAGRAELVRHDLLRQGGESTAPRSRTRSWLNSRRPAKCMQSLQAGTLPQHPGRTGQPPAQPPGAVPTSPVHQRQRRGPQLRGFRSAAVPRAHPTGCRRRPAPWRGRGIGPSGLWPGVVLGTRLPSRAPPSLLRRVTLLRL
jgi:hypothetical protein